MQDKDWCQARHRGAETSREAFDSTSDETRTRQRGMIVEFIRAREPAGATCEETHLALHIPYPTASARISELTRANVLHFRDGERRPTTSGKTARVLHFGAIDKGPMVYRQSDLFGGSVGSRG